MSAKSKPLNKHCLRRSPVAQACLTAAMLLAGGVVSQSALAGAGFGDSVGPDGVTPIRTPTYYAHTPSGARDVIPPEAAALGGAAAAGNTGAALRKFVDPLPLVGKKTKLADGTDKYIPVAQPAKWVRPDGSVSADDYYEIAVVQYAEKLHSDLKKPTLLRGYVQLTKNAASGFPLTYPNGSPILIQNTDANNKLVFNADGSKQMVQAYGLEKPHYFGPTIVATKGTATRVKFLNLLPVGRYDAAAGRNGDLFVPVDETLAGAGVGPDGVTRYTQNRANMHLHGGDTPWISDGTPHQWIAPAGERDRLTQEMAAAGSTATVNEFVKGASAANVPDMNDPGDGAMTYYFPNEQSARLMWYHDHSFGLTRLNVYVGQAAAYELNDPQQKAGLQAIPGFPGDDQTIHLVLQDKTFIPDDIALQDARWNQAMDGKKFDGSPGANAELWGQPGDLWYPHVYEVNQDPMNGADATNPVGRWDWGPYFWPVFPSLYNLPSGAVGDVTITPEAWMDTPLVNGVAYPTLEVDPRAYRMKILNAANDRMWNLSMFVADTAVSTIKVTNGGSGYDPATTTVTLVDKPNAGGSGATAEAVVDAVTGAVTAIRVTGSGTGYTKTPNVFIVDKNGNKSAQAEAVLSVNTEVKMVAAVPASASGLPACQVSATTNLDIAPPYAPPCWPSNWPTDGRDGGVPDPSTAGPAFFQIGSEGGLLPRVAEIAAAPMQYEYNRRSVTVLNTLTHGLFMGNAERADVVVDFSNFAGQTLIVYNDSPAPVPAFDPRNDHWTGKPDESGVGSVETPRAGFGPNTRTVMQIKVKDLVPNNPLALDALKAKLPVLYGAYQEKPVVGQSAYNAATGANWSDAPQADGTKAYATIFTGSLQEPAFKFNPGSATGAFKINVASGGSGYVTPPAITIVPDPLDVITVPATASATLRIADTPVVDGGSGYLYAPAVTFISTSAGTGASAVAWLKVNSVVGFSGGSGYPASTSFRLNFSEPQRSSNPGVPFDKALNTAWGLATTDATGRITSFAIQNPGAGYTMAPLLSPVPRNLDGTLMAGLGAIVYPNPPLVDCAVQEIQLVSNDPNHPEFAGGVGYDNLANVTVAITAPTAPAPLVRRTARTSLSGAVTDITLVNYGSGYNHAPTVLVGAPPAATGITATATTTAGGASILVKNKAIQELFDPTYGRMNATLGVEIPFTSAMTQTTVPLGYVDPVTEEFGDGETQIWKITHNGVDSHPVHFHLLNVQLINRVGWDGTVKPPKENEFGWKETIRMNPLEDIIVAVRAKKPVIKAGFGLPNSLRRRDPSQPEGVPTGFTQIDVKTGLPAPVLNQVDDYGWEYVWHCHILGHEENDFMRPVKFNANEAIPAAPTNVVSNINGNQSVVTWTDNSATEYTFRIERTALNAANQPLAYPGNKPVFALANSQIYADTIPTPPAGTAAIQYKVFAVGANGENGVAAVAGQVVQSPMGLAGSLAPSGAITVSWNNGGNTVTQYVLRASLNNGPFIDVVTQPLQAAAVNSYTYTPATMNTGDSYMFQLVAQSVVNGVTSSSAPALTASNVVYAPPAAPTALATALNTDGSIALSWTETSALANQFTVQALLNGVAVGAPVVQAGTSYTFTPANVAAGNSYSFQVVAQQVLANGSVLASPASVSGATVYAAPTGATNVAAALNAATGTVTVSWAARASVNQYLVQPVLNGVDTGAPIVVAGAATTSMTFTPASVASGQTYTFKVTSQQVVNGSTLTGATVTAAGSAVYAAPAALASVTSALTPTSGTSFNLSWTAATGATQYLVQPLKGGVASGAATTVTGATATVNVGAANPGVFSFQVTAQHNYTAVATGVLSAASATSAATTLAVPTLASATATIGAAPVAPVTTDTVNVSWPAATGTPTTSGYTIVLTDLVGNTYTKTTTTGLTTSFTGLLRTPPAGTPGVQAVNLRNVYTVKVTPTNATGAGTAIVRTVNAN